MSTKPQKLKQTFSRRLETVTPKEWKQQLNYWSDKAKEIREEAEERSKVDWDKIGSSVLK